mgnify:CR=1 FL=1
MWRESSTGQHYWMEVATTGQMGQVLIAPNFPGGTWSYELVSFVRPGDRVLLADGAVELLAASPAFSHAAALRA